MSVVTTSVTSSVADADLNDKHCRESAAVFSSRSQNMIPAIMSRLFRLAFWIDGRKQKYLIYLVN